jgi:hypothetical protein
MHEDNCIERTFYDPHYWICTFEMRENHAMVKNGSTKSIPAVVEPF